MRLVYLLLVVSGGCDQNVELYECANPNKASPIPCPAPPPVVIPAVPKCTGQCVPTTGGLWTKPSLVWWGTTTPIPSCPFEAPVGDFEGFGGVEIVTPPQCGACECEPPEVTCALPSRLTTSTASCPGNAPGSTHVSFDAPAAWDGACSAAYAVAPGAMCNGEPCVASLTTEIPIPISTGCKVKVPEPPEPAKLTWTVSVRSCTGDYPLPCDTPAQECGPKSPLPPPDGFHTCVHQEGDEMCPDGWNNRHVYYAHQQDLIGNWSCSACECGGPLAAWCTSVVSVFGDSACSSLLDIQVVRSDVAPWCSDLSSGIGLGSKSAKIVGSYPGFCVPSGGVVVKANEPPKAETFCCLD